MATVIFEMFVVETVKFTAVCRVTPCGLLDTLYRQLLFASSGRMAKAAGPLGTSLHIKLLTVTSHKTVCKDALHCFAVENGWRPAKMCKVVSFAAHVRDKVAGLRYLRGANTLPTLPLKL
jgi:hypothetical protein